MEAKSLMRAVAMVVFAVSSPAWAFELKEFQPLIGATQVCGAKAAEATFRQIFSEGVGTDRFFPLLKMRILMKTSVDRSYLLVSGVDSDEAIARMAYRLKAVRVAFLPEGVLQKRWERLFKRQGLCDLGMRERYAAEHLEPFDPEKYGFHVHSEGVCKAPRGSSYLNIAHYPYLEFAPAFSGVELDALGNVIKVTMSARDIQIRNSDDPQVTRLVNDGTGQPTRYWVDLPAVVDCLRSEAEL